MRLSLLYALDHTGDFGEGLTGEVKSSTALDSACNLNPIWQESETQAKNESERVRVNSGICSRY